MDPDVPESDAVYANLSGDDEVAFRHAVRPSVTQAELVGDSNFDIPDADNAKAFFGFPRDVDIDSVQRRRLPLWCSWC